MAPSPVWIRNSPAINAAKNSWVETRRLDGTEALDRLTAARPLVLVLEDRQWSDRAPVEWLPYVARRHDDGTQTAPAGG
jgi:hypothetical protein